MRDAALPRAPLSHWAADQAGDLDRSHVLGSLRPSCRVARFFRYYSTASSGLAPCVQAMWPPFLPRRTGEVRSSPLSRRDNSFWLGAAPVLLRTALKERLVLGASHLHIGRQSGDCRDNAYYCKTHGALLSLVLPIPPHHCSTVHPARNLVRRPGDPRLHGDKLCARGRPLELPIAEQKHAGRPHGRLLHAAEQR